MANSIQQHIDRVKDATDQRPALEGARVEPDVITQSWVRCIAEHNLDPAVPESARISPAQEILEHKDQIDDFLHVARFGMEGLYKHVACLDYVLLLTDASGITVDFIGDSKLDKELKGAGLYLGADWSEDQVGTSGIGTCLEIGKSVMCHQTDHFHATHIDLTCSAAPVYDPTGELLAVLDVSALRSPGPRDSQLLASQLVNMYASRIESANFLRHFQHSWIIRFANTPEFVDVATENLLAIDGDGTVLGVTHSAASAMQATASVKSILGRSALEFFECSRDDLFAVSGQPEARGNSLLMTREKHELFYANLIEPKGPSLLTQYTRSNEKNQQALNRLSNNDPLMERLIGRAKRLVDQSVNIILGGETGTGKEVMAQAMHESSCRASNPFVAVNCASIAESLIESELFGYKGGAFTGSSSKGSRGLIMQSNGGTLFLDEIGDMPIQLQSRLLRVLAEKEVLAVGSEKPEKVDLHVISASHRDLRVLISEGRFREDLYYRLNGAILNLPPLRNRADKGYIIMNLLTEETRLREITVKVSSPAMKILLAYSWPGNVRQLRNAIQFALAVCEDNVIGPEDLPDEMLDGDDRFEAPTAPSVMKTLMSTAEEVENYPPDVQLLVSRLRFHQWNITAVSDELEISRSTIYRRMEQYQIVPPNQM